MFGYLLYNSSIIPNNIHKIIHISVFSILLYVIIHFLLIVFLYNLKFVHIYFWLILFLDISIVWFIHTTMDNSHLTIIDNTTNNSPNSISTVLVDLKTPDVETYISNDNLNTEISNDDLETEISNDDEDILNSLANNYVSDDNPESEIELDDFDYNKI